MSGMNIKKGDKVKVLSGKDKGKEGVVLRALPQKERVVVEKVNMIKKAMRPTQQNPQGGISTMEAPIARVQRHGHLPRVQAAHAYGQEARRERQEDPRLQEVRQGHRQIASLRALRAATARSAATAMNMTPAPPGTPGRKSCV